MAKQPDFLVAGKVAAGLALMVRLRNGVTSDAAVVLDRDDCENLITLINIIRCPPEHRGLDGAEE